MGEITRETVRCIEVAFAAKKDFPLTIWEKVQLARAWLERADRRDLSASRDGGTLFVRTNERNYAAMRTEPVVGPITQSEPK